MENENNEQLLKNKILNKMLYYNKYLSEKDYRILILETSAYIDIAFNLINNNIKIYNKILNPILDAYKVSLYNLNRNFNVYQRACLANIYYYLSRNCDLSYKDISYILNIKITEQYISNIVNMYVINPEKLNINDDVKEKIINNNKIIKKQLYSLIK